MTKRTLESLLRKWIIRLKLTDWEISLRYATSEEESKIWGKCMVDTPHVKVASIAIVKPRHKSWNGATRDHETILVHELLHLKRPLDKGDPSTEETINDLARLLIALDRGI